MKVLALAADKGGSAFYRMEEPARVAKALGVDIRVTTDISVSAEQDTSTQLTKVLEIQEDIDLLIVQRPLDNSLTSLIRQAKRQGIATIVELDDDFSTVHSMNVASSNMYDITHSGADWVTKAALEADHLSVSTPALLKYAPHKRATILRNNVPESIFDLEKVARGDTRLSLGWTGSVSTHPVDLQQTKGSIAEILGNSSLQFNVIGDGENVRRNLRLPKDYPLSASGWVDRKDYFLYLATFIDIGIVPLELSKFNQAKSALKGLEMAALGVPFVASPTSEYLRLEAYGVGKTAKSPGDWKRHLNRWIDNTSSLERDAVSYRDRIKESFTYEANASQWLEAWEQAIDYRKKHNE